MRISFLLGPAGSGKTFRCLDEIRNALVSAPEGPALVFIAPKQSTYQLERQLLEDGKLSGFSRLHILSFERLAEFIFSQFGRPLPRVLSEQGRTMVLRALLTRCHDQLSIFRTAARHPGFADELSKQLREFQNHGLSPAALRQLAAQIGGQPHVSAKLGDMALLFEQYNSWLSDRALEDSDALLTQAAELLETATSGIQLGGVWFDGFAQLTPQELRLMVSLLNFAPASKLAFCLAPEVQARSAISPWFLVRQTVDRCRTALEQRYGRESIQCEWLDGAKDASRFAVSPALRQLEQNWTSAAPAAGLPDSAVELVQAADPEAEATFAAREILKHVRSGGRYRDAALLLRDLQNDYPHVLRRVFRRYEIPFFIDHRESVAHHPLAELTRGALRTIAFNWRHADWFAALKCGLLHISSDDLDQLENEALARGWEGSAWRHENGFKIPQNAIREKQLNRLRARLVEPFAALASTLGLRPGAEDLVSGLRALWEAHSIREKLDSWTRENSGSGLHSTVWDQMNAWLDDLALAFPGQHLPLAEWLPILEAGLMNLTVGVVPPVLDQVLIGAVDRSRNPDLKLLFVLGWNERVFPAAPARDSLLSEDDRSALGTTGSTLGEIPALRMAAEQFYGYIACTRARERLCLSYSRAGLDGAQLNPSRFVSQLNRIFPALDTRVFRSPATIDDLVHKGELAALGVPRLLANGSAALTAADQNEKLEPGLALRLYGEELNLSVSSLERFASCPFQFFINHGLRVREREEFALDVREQGSFQHEVLARFHQELTGEGLKWRDLSPAQARDRMGAIADALTQRFHDGLLVANEQNRYTAENYKIALQDFIAVVIDWFKANRFDPERVEFGFGKDTPFPGWSLRLENGRMLVLHGRVDRLDVYRKSDTEAYCVIIDYKSGLQKPDRTLLHYGIQQQLPGYLLATTKVPEIAALFHVEKLTAAGCFLLPLSAHYDRAETRREALNDPGAARRAAYTHQGLFDVEHLPLLDSQREGDASGQFNYRLKNSGEPYRNNFRALTSEDFAKVLSRSEQLMREFGARICEGEIAIHPYKKGSLHACKRCRFQPVCRFDSWVQPYNVLRAPERAEPKKAARKK